MAKITILPEGAVIVTLATKLEDLKMVEKYHPEALVVKGGEDGKEELFKLTTTEPNGHINRYGAAFTKATHGEGFAVVTTTLEKLGGSGDPVDIVADKLGSAVMYLNKIEEGIPAVLAETAAAKAAVVGCITVV